MILGTETTNMNPISYDNLFTLFQCAVSNNLKYPKLRFQMEKGGTLIVKLNGSKSRYEGSIALTNDAGYGSPASRYYGRIEKNGGLVAGRDLTQDIETLLQRIAADPIGVAAELGKLHGACVFCGKALTDQTSAAFGYGKVCSTKFGLPYTTKGKARKIIPTMLDGTPCSTDQEYEARTREIAKEMLEVAMEDAVLEYIAEEMPASVAQAAIKAVQS
jgi:hypothetical protein